MNLSEFRRAGMGRMGLDHHGATGCQGRGRIAAGNREDALRIFFVGGLISFRALFNWIKPSLYIPTMFGSPASIARRRY